MVICCVINCGSRSYDGTGEPADNGVRFFSFPSWNQNSGPQVSRLTGRRRMAWVAAVGRSSITFDNIPQNIFVCSRHFHSGKPADQISESDRDWVPSLHLGHTDIILPQKEQFNQITTDEPSAVQQRKKSRDISWLKFQRADVGANEHCFVPYCSSSSRCNGKLSFHAFPKDTSLRAEWLRKIGRTGLTVTAHTKVCSRHFDDSKIITSLKGRRILVAGSIPTLFEWNNYSKVLHDHDYATICSVSLDQEQCTDELRRRKPARQRGQTSDSSPEENRTYSSGSCPTICYVKRCHSRSHNHLGQPIPDSPSFYHFPAWITNQGEQVNELTWRQRLAWLAALGRTDIPFDQIKPSMTVCSRHFYSGKPASEMMESDPDWAPSLNMGPQEEDTQDAPQMTMVVKKKKKKKKQRQKSVSSRQAQVAEVAEKRPTAVMEDGDNAVETLAHPGAEQMMALSFRDYFRQSLEASLDASIMARSLFRSPSSSSGQYEVKVDVRLPSAAGEPEQPGTSHSSCEKCIRLRKEVCDLEDRLSQISERLKSAVWRTSYYRSQERNGEKSAV
ncbi:uncharacterized protein KZ484_009032 [Pholidichthys leucotaenia]